MLELTEQPLTQPVLTCGCIMSKEHLDTNCTYKVVDNVEKQLITLSVTNYIMIVSDFLNIFIPADLQVVNIIFNLSQNNTKMIQIDALNIFSEKPPHIQYNDVSLAVEVGRVGCTVKCSHSMRLCTLESSLFPLSAVAVILHLPLTSRLLPQHTVHVKEPRKHNICQCTNLQNEHQRKKDIYIHTSK